MEYFGNTDIGKKRKSNQDSFCIHKIAEHVVLCAVFDGMGGHAGGETASRIAGESFCSVVTEMLTPMVNGSTGMLDATKTQIFNVMNKAAESANAAVYDTALRSPELSGMGTTLAAVLINGSMSYALNIGDSRIYSISEGKIEQISHDHSYVQYLIDMGEITAEEAKTNTNKSIITRAVGTSDSIEADNYVHNADGAVLLLCSDGLSNMVEDDVLCSIIAEHTDTRSCVDALINTANENGGSDNITAIVIRI